MTRSARRSLEKHGRAFELLLRLYPPTFRSHFGREMESVFAERLRTDGPLTAWRIAFPEFIWSLLYEYADVIAFWFRGARGIVGNIWTRTTSSMFEDLRFSFRSLRRAPGYSFVAILTLALGIGLNVGMYSIIDRVLLNSLSFDKDDRFAYILRRDAEQGWSTSPSLEVAEALRESPPRSFDVLEEYRRLGGVLVGTDRGTGRAEPVSVAVTEVSATFMVNTGLRPLAGRVFVPSDGSSGVNMVVLTGETWRSQFGADPDIVGESIALGDSSYLVVGVLETDFDLAMTGSPDIWKLRHDGTSDGVSPQGILARLSEGYTFEEAQAELDVIAASIGNDGGTFDRWTLMVVSSADMVGGDSTRNLWVLFGAVALLLLLACANVANLSLARGLRRGQELAARLALGANRWQLVRLLMAESLIVSGLAGAAGLFFAHLLTRWAVLNGPRLRNLEFVEIGAASVGFTLLAILLTAVAAGLFPSVQLTAMNLSDRLRSGNRFETLSRSQNRVRQFLLGAQVSGALVLLVGAALFVRQFAGELTTPVGVDLNGLYTFDISLPEHRYSSREARSVTNGQIEEAARSIPGVEAAMIVPGAPPYYSINFGEPRVDGVDYQPRSDVFVDLAAVPADFFSVLGTEMVTGRAFLEDEIDGVVIVGRAWADRVLGQEEPVGRRIAWSDDSWMTIVGVVDDVVSSPSRRAPEGHGQFYTPLTDIAYARNLVVRSELPREALVTAVQQAIWRVEPEAPVSVNAVGESYRDLLDKEEFVASLLSGFGLLALIVAALGVQGVISLAVRQRLPELGIRVVFGAGSREISSLVLRDGMLPVVVGAAIGLLACLLGYRFVSNQVEFNAAVDSWLVGGILSVLLLIGISACVGPMIRALRVDPVETMRS